MDVVYQFDVVVRQLTYGGDDSVNGRVRNETFNRIMYKNPPKEQLPVKPGSSADAIPYPGLGNLMRLLRRVYSVNPKLSAFLYYEDPEGDIVRLSSEREWREVIKNSLKVVFIDREKNAHVNLLFSPKHHYKVNMHGKVNFAQFNFVEAIYQVDENQMLQPSQKEPEVTAEPQVTEPAEETNSLSTNVDDFTPDSTLCNEAIIASRTVSTQQLDEICVSSSQTEEVVTKEQYSQVEKTVADKMSVCTIIKEEYVPTPDMQRIELIDYVKEQLPALVDEFLRTKAQTCIAKLAENENDQSSGIGDAAPYEVCSSGTAQNVTEMENEINCSNGSHVKSILPCKLFYKFLFHENLHGELYVIPGFEFRKVWFVQNTGACSWPENMKVKFAENTTEWNLKDSFVPKLESGEIGGIYASIVAPRTSGICTMRFTLKSDQASGYDLGDNEPLVCLVHVIANPLEFSVMQSNETEVAEQDESANLEVRPGSVEIDDTEMDPDDDITSTCEDETIYDSTDEDSELIDDFTVVPLPDCFDLNRVPALQSSLVQRSCSEGSTQNHLDQLNAMMGGQAVHDEEQFSNFGSCQEGLNDVNNDEEFIVEDANDSRDESESAELTSINTVVIACNESFHTPRNEETEDDHNNAVPEVEGAPNSTGETRVAESESGPKLHGSLERSTELDDNVAESSKSIIRVSASEEKSLLDRLTKLGFGDREQNRQLLVKHDYNLQSVVKELINSFEPLR